MLVRNQKGFSLIELLIVITILGIVSGIFTVAFNTNLRQYLGLQKDATAFSNLAQQSQRISNVLRGSTDIIEATDDSITVYAYFYPNNEYVSLIKYYLNSDKTQLFADVTPMTSNPPIGTPLTDDTKTYTIIDSYNQLSGVKLFEYFDSNNNQLSAPVSDLIAINSIKISLVTPSDGQSDNVNQTIFTEVNLRNRMTNL